MKQELTAVAIASLVAAALLAGVSMQACTTDGGGDVVGGAPIAPTGNVTTYHNDLSRDGIFADETLLTPANVTAATFGRVGSLPVDGVVYAQPLVARGVVTKSGVRDLVVVVTEHDSVYAFDANSLSPTPLWRNNFIGDKRSGNDLTASCSGCSTLSPTDTQVPNILPEVGITATPVIDPTNGVMYVVAPSKDGGGGFHMQLHALNIADGTEQGSGPVEIQGAYPGTGLANVGGTIYFDPSVQLSRSGLVLVPGKDGGHGTVMFGFSSFSDRLPARGWFFAYDATTLEQIGTFVTTPNSALGCIWMAGGAPAVDSNGNIYFSTGSGDPNGIALGDYEVSILKMGFDPAVGFSVADFFTPYNRTPLDDYDLDTGSGGVLLLPDQPGNAPHLLVQAGKIGTIYLLNRDPGQLGGRENPNGTTDSTVVQELTRALSPETPNSFDTGLYSTPTYWNGRVYFAPISSTLRSYLLSNGQFSTDPDDLDIANEQIDGRGASVSISANGTSNGVLWLIDDSAYGYSGWNPSTFTVSGVRNGPAVLYAYDPSDLSKPLYASNAQGTLDTAGNAAKFAVPTIAGGHVYVATQGEITVYGQLTQRTVPTPTPTPAPPAKLSETGLFTDLSALTPAAGMIEYTVNSPLWSDGAIKRRWLKLPAGGQIAFDPLQPWVFPVGTQMVKHFELALADGTTTRLETRVLTYSSTGWSGVSYQWTDDQSDAVLVVDGASADYQVPDPSNPGGSITQTWNIPTSNDCLTCHTQVAGYALGVNTRQLNTSFNYASGSQNQLTYLNGLSLFTQDIGDPTQYGSYAAAGDTTRTITDRARSYLAVNCAICHQPGGPTDVGMDFRAETLVDQMNAVGVAPTKGNGGVTGADIITAGNHAASVVWLRMDTTQPGRMPPLGSTVIDTTGVSAVAAWIDSLSTTSSTPAAQKAQTLGDFAPNGERIIRYLPRPRPNSTQ